MKYKYETRMLVFVYKMLFFNLQTHVEKREYIYTVYGSKQRVRELHAFYAIASL